MKSNESANRQPGTERPSSRPPSAAPRAMTILPVVGRSDVTRHCWEVIQSRDNNLHGDCEECYAHFVQQDCWTLWALREAGHKPCCQKREDCATCPVLLTQIAPQTNETVQVRARAPMKAPVMRTGSAKQVCRYLDAGDIPVSPDSERYISAVSRAIQTRSASFRCRLRGVHLDVGFVTDICVSRHVQECVFLEEPHPEITVRESALKSPLDKRPDDEGEGREAGGEGREAGGERREARGERRETEGERRK